MLQVGEKIWMVQGDQPGPTLTITGGIHGNEKTGIEVVLHLRDKIERGEITILAGTLYLALGNLQAIEMHERATAAHRDLNRVFYPDLLEREPDGTYEDKRARELAPFFLESKYLVDLHATNKPSEPFLACFRTDKEVQDVYQWYECDKVLVDRNHVIGGEPVTTDEYVEIRGGIGIAFETGQADDVTRIAEVEEQTMNLLAHLGFVQGDPVAPDRSDQEVYELIESILLTDVGWKYEEGMGERSWQPVSNGQTIGFHGAEPFVASYDGVIVFPKLPEHRTLGKPVGYLAKKISA